MADRKLKLGGIMEQHARNMSAPGIILPKVKDNMLKHYGWDVGRDPTVIHAIVRYFEFVKESGDCLVWSGSTDEKGYGMFWLDGKSNRAHRVMYFFLFGDWPEDKLLHSCDNPPCVAPWHLSPGTHADNMTDMKNKGRGRTSPGREGEGNPAAKLTEDDVRNIRARYSSGTGVVQQDLATEYGISRSHVSLIVNRRLWGHVE